jgi:hypothetical protein
VLSWNYDPAGGGKGRAKNPSKLLCTFEEVSRGCSGEVRCKDCFVHMGVGFDLDLKMESSKVTAMELALNLDLAASHWALK